MNMHDIKEVQGCSSKLAMEYMDNKRAIAKLTEKQDKLKIKIDNRMVLKNCKMLFYNGEYVEKTDNPKVTINVAKFKSAVKSTEFMQCVKIDIKKARKLLSEGQVKQIIISKSGDKFITGAIKE